MKSRLLSRQELDALSEAGNMRALIAALAKTPYRRPLEAALVHLAGREAVLRAVRDDLETTLASIRQFYRGDAADKVGIVLRVYDVRNVKALLRGLSSHATPDEIRSSLLPVGELSGDVLSELAQAANPRVAIDLLASMALPFAAPLLRLRAERPGATTLEMELRLDQWYFQQAFDTLQEEADETLLAALHLEADLINLLSILRLASMPEEQEALQKALGAEELERLFVGPGRIPANLLVRAASQETVHEVVDLLEQTAYAAPLAAGMDAYRQTGRLSSFERQLYRFRLVRLARLIARHPLGIGVVLGYLAVKTNEVNDLRWIANGIHLSMRPEKIRAELVYAP